MVQQQQEQNNFITGLSVKMRIAILDYARFFAAFSVVTYHLFYSGFNLGKITSIDSPFYAEYFQYGHYGVQFFFIISGYVIFISLKNRDAASFMKSRLKRLYPTYWIAIIFTAFFAYLWGQGTDMEVTLKQVLVNFTMLQQFVGVQNVDGVYWTLFYEIVFYAIVFLILLFGDFKKLLAFLVVWPILIIAANIFNNGFLIFNLYFSFFVMGAMFALLKNKHIKRSIAFITLVVAACAGFYQMYQAGIAKGNNILVVGLIYAAMLSFFTLLNVDRFRSISLPRAQDIGGMTYPIYLIHAHFGYMALNQFATPENQVLVYALLLIVVVSLSWILWYVVEVRQANFWHRLFSFTVKPVEKIEAKLNQ